MYGNRQLRGSYAMNIRYLQYAEEGIDGRQKAHTTGMRPNHGNRTPITSMHSTLPKGHAEPVVECRRNVSIEGRGHIHPGPQDRGQPDWGMSAASWVADLEGAVVAHSLVACNVLGVLVAVEKMCSDLTCEDNIADSVEVKRESDKGRPSGCITR